MNENRRADDALIPQIMATLEQIQRDLAENTKRTNQVYEETRDVVKMVNQGRGFFAVCDWIAGKVKMLTLVVGGIGAVLLGFYEYLKSRWLK
jgi:hypothetical protein